MRWEIITLEPKTLPVWVAYAWRLPIPPALRKAIPYRARNHPTIAVASLQTKVVSNIRDATAL